MVTVHRPSLQGTPRQHRRTTLKAIPNSPLSDVQCELDEGNRRPIGPDVPPQHVGSGYADGLGSEDRHLNIPRRHTAHFVVLVSDICSRVKLGLCGVQEMLRTIRLQNMGDMIATHDFRSCFRSPPVLTAGGLGTKRTDKGIVYGGWPEREHVVSTASHGQIIAYSVASHPFRPRPAHSWVPSARSSPKPTLQAITPVVCPPLLPAGPHTCPGGFLSTSRAVRTQPLCMLW